MAKKNAANVVGVKTKTTWKQAFKRDWQLYLLLLLPLIMVFVFSYGAYPGLRMAFMDYKPAKGYAGSEWVGMKTFVKIFKDADFMRALRNSIVFNLADLIIGFPMPIILALILNELRYPRFKKVSQTILYLPHFLSWAIIGSVAMTMFRPNSGLVNILLTNLGVISEGIPFLNEKWHWAITYLLIGVWQTMGWGTILYLAAITGINGELYEAAMIDGANRWKRMWHITLPGIKSTVVTLLILNLGRVMGSNLERLTALENSQVKDFQYQLAVYIYNKGIGAGKFSAATAVGLFQWMTITAIMTKSLMRNLLTACAPPAEVDSSLILTSFFFISLTSYSNPSSPSFFANLSDNRTRINPINDCASCVLPFLHVAVKSISGNTAVMSKSVYFWPKDITFDAYKKVFADNSMTYSMIFSVIVTVIFTALGMLVCTCAAYPLSKKRLKGKKLLTFLLMVPMYFSAGIIPSYLLYQKLHVLDTMWVLILPLIYSPYNMLIMKNYFQSTIPDSLEESAFLDGASNFQILSKIVLPLSKPILATLSLFYAVGRWNSYADNMYYTKSANLKLIQYKLYQLVASAAEAQTSSLADTGSAIQSTPEVLQAASIMFVTIPIIIIYPFLQKYFVQGTMIGAVKG
ncbi:ABC transporter permease subunit [Waltera sp.]|uniref:ABC transporter permease subunit n=1 Tax=Waltera sp. TaxID=2815806 RepID=UPI003AB96DBE